MGIISTVKTEIKNLSPTYFALVMATGIISIGANALGFPVISDYLFWINNVAYAVLLLLLLARLLFYFQHFYSDLTSFKKGAGFFTFIAGTCVLGTQYAQLKQGYIIASGLFWIGLVVWVLMIYAFFLTITTKQEKTDLEKGISGVWLLMVVATQSLAVLGTLLSSHLPFKPEQVLFFTLAAFLLGIMLYIILITLIFYRLTFFPTKPKEVTAPYWINEGAMAITALAGATLLQSLHSAPGMADFAPFIKGFSLFAWIVATWWIPIIASLEVWKYLIKKVSLSYNPSLWSLGFCLGMYTVATQKLSKALNTPFIQSLSEVFIYISFAVWGLVMLGLVISLVKSLTSDTNKSSG